MITGFFLILEFICYDDGCHLRKYARHSSRCDLTPTTKKLAEVEIVIDKMHMSGHVDNWCLQNCDPKKFKELDTHVYYPVSTTFFSYIG